LNPGAVPDIVHDVAAERVQVSTTSGRVAGVGSAAGRAFLGIPYAAAPTGEWRWRAPQPPQPWTEVRDASKLGHICVQNLSLNPWLGQSGGLIVVGDEDCLNLNVYTPPDIGVGERLPVMVWIYGGGLVIGWSGQYDPSVLAKSQRVIVVTINYRTGALGFLAHPALRAESSKQGGSGVFALLDQQMALHWVQANIARFGGDPHQVTLFGQSAGSFSTCYQLVSPGAAGLFQRAILQSGPCASPMAVLPAREAEQGGERFAATLGCGDPSTAIACLRAKPAADLVRALPDRAGLLGPNSWSPAYGNPVLPLRPLEAFARGAFHHVPVITGTTRDEARLFADLQRVAGNLTSPANYTSTVAHLFGPAALPAVLAAYPAGAYPSVALAYAAAVTDSVFSCATRTLNRLLARQTPVYAYEFDDPNAVTRLPQWPSALPLPFTLKLKSFHTAEIAYVFDAPWALADPDDFSPAQQLLSRTMQVYWGSFARAGVPRAAPAWRRYNAATDVIQALRPAGIGSNDSFATDHHCAMWARLGF
jgi:para-nitrobenzyl esterase